jgi:hypothetical protein
MSSTRGGSYAAGCLIELRGELADQTPARIPDRS